MDLSFYFLYVLFLTKMKVQEDVYRNDGSFLLLDCIEVCQTAHFYTTIIIKTLIFFSEIIVQLKIYLLILKRSVLE